MLSASASNKIALHIHHSPCDWTQQGHAKPETKAKINVSCVNCDFGEIRDWRGWIIGKGITGSLSAFLTRIKHKNKLLNRNTPLMRLLTICDDCCIELNWTGRPNQDHIPEYWKSQQNIGNFDLKPLVQRGRSSCLEPKNYNEGGAYERDQNSRYRWPVGRMAVIEQ